MNSSDINRKSVGMLVDELITTSLKCWHAQEVVCGNSDAEEVAAAAKTAQRLNARRNGLIRALDERLGESGLSPTEKTYE